jgi:hypothetical protein
MGGEWGWGGSDMREKAEGWHMGHVHRVGLEASGEEWLPSGPGSQWE